MPVQISLVTKFPNCRLSHSLHIAGLNLALQNKLFKSVC